MENPEQVPVTARTRHASVAGLRHDGTRENAGRAGIGYLAGTGRADPVRDVTFEQLMRHVLQAANLLNAHGIGPHDTVTLLMPSVPETFFALWGAEIAAVANPVNYFLEASQIAAIMKQAGAPALHAAGPPDSPAQLPQRGGRPAAMPRTQELPT